MESDTHKQGGRKDVSLWQRPGDGRAEWSYREQPGQEESIKRQAGTWTWVPGMWLFEHTVGNRASFSKWLSLKPWQLRSQRKHITKAPSSSRTRRSRLPVQSPVELKAR